MDVISIPVEYDEKKIDGRYRLVVAVLKRAKELYQDAMPKISSNSAKMTTVALEEIISGKVRVLTGKDAIKAKEEAGKLTYDDMMDEAKQKASLPEELTKLEKDLKVYLHKKDKMNSKETKRENS
jgi:DNA-directed RNA polymerase omega subunit